MTEVCVRPADRALPRSFFTIRRTLDDIPGANRADRFALYGGLWHWHEYNDENPNGIEIEVTDTLRECATWLYKQVIAVDYPNFKDRVHETRGHDFAGTLLSVWSAMQQIEDAEAR